MFLEEIPIGIVVSDITNKVPFLRHVTSNIYFVVFKEQCSNRSTSRSSIKVKVKKKGHMSKVKGQGHVFSAIVVIFYNK